MVPEEAGRLSELPGRDDGPGDRRQQVHREGRPALAKALADLRVFDDPAALARAAAEEFFRGAREAIARRGRFTVALSGGGTPRRTHAEIAARAGDLDWSAVHFFWSDERCVPPDDPESNYRMARETLLSPLRVSPPNVHRWRAEREPREAAEAYEKEIGTVIGDAGSFDLVFLGVGGDGHTASLFPATEALSVLDRRATENFVPALGRWRLTLTYAALNTAGEVLFLAEGAGKSEIIDQMRRGGDFPASRVHAGKTLWFVDQAAAARIADAGS